MTKRLEIGWKVLTKDRRSCIVMGEYSVDYPKGRRVYPRGKCGPLAVFAREDHAVYFSNFTMIEDATIVVKCKYKKSKTRELFVPTARFILGDGLDRLIHVLCPLGTDFADFVTCLE